MRWKRGGSSWVWGRRMQKTGLDGGWWVAVETCPAEKSPAEKICLLPPNTMNVGRIESKVCVCVCVCKWDCIPAFLPHLQSNVYTPLKELLSLIPVLFTPFTSSAGLEPGTHTFQAEYSVFLCVCVRACVSAPRLATHEHSCRHPRDQDSSGGGQHQGAEVSGALCSRQWERDRRQSCL